MNDERLAEIRQSYATWEYSDDDGSHVADMVPELLDHIDELTRQRDDARRIAIDSGYFQNNHNWEYTLDLDNMWIADPVGPVAWDKQEQQR